MGDPPGNGGGRPPGSDAGKDAVMSLVALTQRPVHTVLGSHTVLEAAKRMCEHAVGALVVTDNDGTTPLGVVTDRDLVWMIAEGLDPKIAEVAQFARAPLHTVSVSDSVADAVRTMREHGVRRLPIVDGEHHLVGLVSLDDVLALLGQEMADVAATISGELAVERRITAT